MIILQAGSKTVQGHLQCLCTHLSAFGGNIFVAPNPIDFDKVWIEFERLAKSGNVVVLCAVCLIFGIYFVALIFTRRADKQDRTKVEVNSYWFNWLCHYFWGYPSSYQNQISPGNINASLIKEVMRIKDMRNP